MSDKEHPRLEGMFEVYDILSDAVDNVTKAVDTLYHLEVLDEEMENKLGSVRDAVLGLYNFFGEEYGMAVRKAREETERKENG
jgi:hypothetical protein